MLELYSTLPIRATGGRRIPRIAIVHRNAPEFVVAYFAINRLGAIAVPINFMVSKADELAYMLGDVRQQELPRRRSRRVYAATHFFTVSHARVVTLFPKVSSMSFMNTAPPLLGT